MIIRDGFSFFFGNQDLFSNWNDSRFTVKKIEFAHGEQYLTYAKAMLFKDYETAEVILGKTVPPKRCKGLGRAVRNFNQRVWDERCLPIMTAGLFEKASQNPDVLALLAATEGTVIVEASKYDSVWGIGVSEWDPISTRPEEWPGENLLGQAWMNVRHIFFGWNVCRHMGVGYREDVLLADAVAPGLYSSLRLHSEA